VELIHNRHHGCEWKRPSIFLVFLLAALSANADSEIYKCVDVDGNVAYQQTPCPVVKEEAEVVEVVEVVEEVPQAPAESNQTHEEVEACKDPLRDAIDEIEAEMLRGFSPEQGEEFKVKLRTLTQEMRACG
jgi:hypothetical protein